MLGCALGVALPGARLEKLANVVRIEHRAGKLRVVCAQAGKGEGEGEARD
jgi:hypothetical protein